jgi:putative transposase
MSNTSRERRSLRLPAYDYARHGAYFFTIVTAHRPSLLGDVVDDDMRVSGAGQSVLAVWQDLPVRFPAVELDAFVVMPNHVHGVMWLVEPGAASSAPPLGEVLRAFKSLTAQAINRLNGTTGAVWQRNYFERVVRDEAELQVIRRYIVENPLRWALDHENPRRRGP